VIAPASYEAGKIAALNQYGLSRSMPQGPTHVGAERLAKMLTDVEPDHAPKGAAPRKNSGRLERPTRWGEKSPVDSGSMGSQAGSGIGAFGGV
jgi:hypothetical protein